MSVTAQIIKMEHLHYLSVVTITFLKLSSYQFCTFLKHSKSAYSYKYVRNIKIKEHHINF